MIEVTRVTKTFKPGAGLFEMFRRGAGVVALDDVHLNVREGEIAALLGPNGAGKTTLIKILTSLILPDEGQVRIGGMDIRKDGAKVKTMVGLAVGEERSFYFRLTGRQNLSFFASLYSLHGGAAKRKINDIADLLGIEGLDRRFQEYSTGMKQRLTIARCLLGDAKVVFMDEPTKSLDPVAASDFRKLIREKLVGELGRTVLFATHQTGEAEEIADKIAVMDHGRIKAFGSIEELRSKIDDPGAGVKEIYRWSVSS
jgi:ABC-2 type transport system ATP-binding protein